MKHVCRILSEKFSALVKADACFITHKRERTQDEKDTCALSHDAIYMSLVRLYLPKLLQNFLLQRVGDGGPPVAWVGDGGTGGKRKQVAETDTGVSF